MSLENNIQATCAAAENRTAEQNMAKQSAAEPDTVEKLVAEKNIAEQNAVEQNTAEKPRTGGSILERRFRLYDKVKISVKALDIIIAVAAILILVFFILGAYHR